MRRSAKLAIASCCVALALAPAPSPARAAFNPIGTVCGIGGLVSGVVGKACNIGGKVLGVGKKVLGSSGTSSGSTSTKAQAVIGLAAIGAWVLVGAKVALHETAKVIAHTTAPRLLTTWFSSTYWRMAAIGAILTLPFLFAAAVQALLRSDLALLLRAAFGYLPLALIGVGIAAPIAMLLLAATDEMCAVVSAAAGNAGEHFLSHAGAIAGGLSLFAGSPFLALLAGMVAAFGALVLWLELLMREAAVYIVVLMLPIAFSAMVWPARRIWATRAVELLVALILSKFAIVAVLSLGGAALGQSPFGGISSMLAGGVLVILGAFAPWAMIRLLPLAELASSAAGTLSREPWQAGRALSAAGNTADAISGRLLAAGEADGADDLEPADAPQEAARAETSRLAQLPGLPVAPGGREPGDEDGDSGGAKDGGVPPAGGPEGPDGGAPPAGGADGPDGADGERLPGLDPQYQMDDFSWRLELGPDQEWPPPPVARFDGEPDGGLAAGEPPGPEAPPGTDRSQDAPPGPADDPDPRPPSQDRDDGRL